MTIEEKRKIIDEFCNNRCCKNCPLIRKSFWEHDIYISKEPCLEIENASEKELDMALTLIHHPIPNDPVNHPSHYTKGKIEVADFIADQKLNFDRGNAVKYVCRAGSKDPEKEVQDLEKAIWYINHEIKMLKGECENGTAEKET
jgi:hypothetical protein